MKNINFYLGSSLGLSKQGSNYCKVYAVVLGKVPVGFFTNCDR